MTDLPGRLLSTLVLDGLGRLPLGVRRSLGRAMGTLASLIPTRERAVALAQLQATSIEGDHAAIIRGMFTNLTTSLFESINIQPVLEQCRVHLSEQSDQELQGLLSSGRGVLALTGHCGNWDLLGAYFAARGLNVVTIGREARNPSVHTLLEEMRTRLGVRTIWRSDRSGVRDILAVLKGGGVLAALIDQDTQVTSVFSPFFGRPAKTPSSLVEMAIRYECAICAVFIARKDNDTFEITLREISTENGCLGVLDSYHRHLEGFIRRDPTQWVWFHKRWRSARGGATMSSADYLAALRSGTLFDSTMTPKISHDS